MPQRVGACEQIAERRLARRTLPSPLTAAQPRAWPRSPIRGGCAPHAQQRPGARQPPRRPAYQSPPVKGEARLMVSGLSDSRCAAKTAGEPETACTERHAPATRWTSSAAASLLCAQPPTAAAATPMPMLSLGPEQGARCHRLPRRGRPRRTAS
eukprot:scaffold27185_cov97-Isochrysis_galbana.AAC.6